MCVNSHGQCMINQCTLLIDQHLFLAYAEITAGTFANTLPTNSDVRNYIGNFLNPSHLPPNFNLDHYTSYFQRGTFFVPHLCYLMSFIHLMLCNHYIISVMIVLYYVTILEMQYNSHFVKSLKMEVNKWILFNDQTRHVLFVVIFREVEKFEDTKG
jgi:hypothetical protein